MIINIALIALLAIPGSMVVQWFMLSIALIALLAIPGSMRLLDWHPLVGIIANFMDNLGLYS